MYATPSSHVPVADGPAPALERRLLDNRPGSGATARPVPTLTTWRVDPEESVGRFTVRNFGVVPVQGTVPLQGTVVTDSSGTVVRVTGTADPAGIDTGNPRRDADLQGRRLLATAEHPAWTYVCEDVVETSTGWLLTGDLSVRAACPLVLDVRHPRKADDGTVRLVATATLDRRAAGVRAPRVLIGHRIDVRLEIVLRPGPGGA